MRYLIVWIPLLAVMGPVRAEEPVRLKPDRRALEITGDTTLEAGEWLVAGREGEAVLVIRTDGVTLDLGGATLRGAAPEVARDGLVGTGILIENARGVTVLNGAVAGFKVGIRAVNAPGLVVEEVDASGGFRQRLKSTPEREDASDWLWPHHNDEGEWESRYGAAISLNDCEGARLRRCTARRGQNGLLLTRCTKCFVYDNDFSFNSGWGVGMYRTTHTQVVCNRLDFCVRGYSHGVYHRGQDSAAILAFEQCSHNVFVRNSATHSGDGFFLYAGHETTQRTGRGGSNHNQVFANDFRYAVANGIEATFSEGNVFAFNDCSGSDHGIWAGYSYRSRFYANHCSDCMTAGISVEHGHENSYESNECAGARYGLHLWWDEDKQFLEGVYGRNQDCSSSGNEIHWNRLSGTVAALRLDGDAGSRVTRNQFTAPEARIQFLGASRLAEMAHNRFEDRLAILNRTPGEVEIMDPRPPGGLETEGLPLRLEPYRPPPPITPTPPPATPEIFCTQDARYPKAMPHGREQMRIDEWGPLDPRETVLFPSHQSAPGAEAKVHLLGTGSFRITSITDGVVAEPMEGRAPATLVVRAEGEGPVLRDFRVTVAAGGAELVATGTLTRICWDVGFYEWKEAAHPIEKPEAFAKLLEGKPTVTQELAGLDFPWQGGGPEGVRRDGFATLARAEVTCPEPTTVRLRVVSDDGVRVEVNGTTVIERWDRHGPTEDVADVELREGANEIRVTHFELDGWAWLSVRLENP